MIFIVCRYIYEKIIIKNKVYNSFFVLLYLEDPRKLDIWLNDNYSTYQV